MQQPIEIYQPKTITLTSTPLWESKIDIVRRMYCAELTEDEIEVFLHICRHTNLDPSMKQIYAIKRKGKLTIQTGIDGYRLIAERTGKYAPGREPTYSYNDKGALISATAYVKKITSDGTWHEVSATAFFDEYCQRDAQGIPTQFWRKFRHVMIAKCAETLALRKAFPGDLSAIRTDEEMMQAEILPAVDTNILQNNSDAKLLQIDNSNGSEKILVGKITDAQITEISEMLSNCSEKYIKKFWESMEKGGIKDWTDIQNDQYCTIKTSISSQMKKENRKK